MALRALLDRGIGSILEEGDSELTALAREAGLEPGADEHLRQTLQALPGLVEQIHGALQGKDVPASARSIFLGVMRYLFLEEDLIPSRTGTTVLGLMDDTYLVHRAAQEMRDQLYPVDMRSVDGGAHLLGRVLPKDVIGQLDGIVEKARTE